MAVTAVWTRAEAAAYLKVSVRAFDAHVRPDLTPIRVGRCVRFLQRDVEAWADRTRDGDSDGGAKTSRSDSRTPVDRSSSAQVPLTLSELRRLPRENIPRWCLADAQPDELDRAVAQGRRLARLVRNG